MTMTPKEELIQAIERSPDELIRVLLDLLKVLQTKQSSDAVLPVLQKTAEPSTTKTMSKRLRRKQEILVIETSHLNGFDMNEFIDQVREERFQQQTGNIN
jgi:hypothetical protein